MISFADLTKQVHLINDLILTDMTYETEETLDEATTFSRHLLATKSWFSRISWANKKRFVLALLEDVQSAWTLSLLLKSLWNCRPKDAVMSVSGKTVWSCYDEVPMDHNRTALPTTLLAQVMKNDRHWFLSLGPEAQAMVLSELLTIAGGQVMWVVLRRAQTLYERYRDHQLQNLQESFVRPESPQEKVVVDKAVKKETLDQKTMPAMAISGAMTTNATKETLNSQKELEANLAAWEGTIKSMKDNLKLEEFEFASSDGTKRKIWKVNRPKPEDKETVDFLQLLPSSVGKQIISYLPRGHLADYARVNKYWSFLVEEFRAELAARQKINLDYNKLYETMLRHDTSLERIDQIGVANVAPFSSVANTSTALSLKARPAFSIKASEKSGGAYSMRHFLSEKLNKPFAVQTPIRNMAELTGRLDQRGAADENLWKWCENILKRAKHKDRKPDHQEGVLALENVHFPCPLMKRCLEVPLYPPLYKNPAVTAPPKPRRNISDATVLQIPREQGIKRYSLWAKDFSGLYPVYKIPSYQYPI